MEEFNLERIIRDSIQIGVRSTLRELGLIDENMSERQAIRRYGKKQIREWREKGWIVGYVSGNKKLSKTCFKRSELEIASLMVDSQNSISGSKIFHLKTHPNATY